MRYRKRVAEHLQAARDEGRTRKEIAGRLGVGPNFISMLVRSNYDDQLAMDRLPLLSELCGLDDREVAQLVLLRATDAGEDCIEMSGETLLWVLARVCRARDEVRSTSLSSARSVTKSASPLSTAREHRT